MLKRVEPTGAAKYVEFTTLLDPEQVPGQRKGILNFGGYTPSEHGAPGEWTMIFGRRAFFGYVVDDRGGTVWFVNVPRHAATPEERRVRPASGWQRWLGSLFADDAGPAAQLIAEDHR